MSKQIVIELDVPCQAVSALSVPCQGTAEAPPARIGRQLPCLACASRHTIWHAA